MDENSNNTISNSFQKCYSQSHNKEKATNYCDKCKKFLCETCSTTHCDKNPRHYLFSLEKDLNFNFTGICTEKNHKNDLDYFCLTHNNLCCAACLCKIKDQGDGQHYECKACHINEIKNEKKIKLEKNIKQLKNISSHRMEKMINIIKKVEQINDIFNSRKEEIKNNIVTIFKKFRKLIDIRERELLKELDDLYSEKIFKNDFIKECNKIPSLIEYNLKYGKLYLENWQNYEEEGKLNILINGTIYIEKLVEKIQKIKEKIKSISLNSNILFISQGNDEELISEKIKNFGKILFHDYKYTFKKCPENIDDKKKFIISGKKGNIMKKTGPNFVWTGTTCLSEFQNFVEYKWKIKILKSDANQIMVGVAPNDFSADKIDINDFSRNICGWYFYCHDLKLYSGPPHNYRNKNTNFNFFEDEIVLVMDMNKKTLKFIINNVDKGFQYENIPIDKPLFPVVCLFSPDIVEITGL